MEWHMEWHVEWHGNVNLEISFLRQFKTSGIFFRDKNAHNAVYRFMWVIFLCLDQFLPWESEC